MVELRKLNMGEILQSIKTQNTLDAPLRIPDYQRAYCWREKNVLLLLDDVFDHTEHIYHLGTVILHFKDGRYDIIDGQQRLITLSLLLQALGETDVALLREHLRSKEAMRYAAYNKYLIQNYISRRGWTSEEKKEQAEKLLSNLIMDVLILSDGNLDLAYTFFSSQNTRGKALTDYELLKSHHLRYIPIEKQQEHLAGKWDALLMQSEQNTPEHRGDRSVSITLGVYLFCLRKWTRKHEWYYKERNLVKNEFEAAPIIAEIPPFGEQFQYNEAIQGGTHFFAFVEQFVYRYRHFQETDQYKILQQTISCSGMSKKTENNGIVDNRRRTHWWYGDVIATFLFAYYLKFGEEYLAEALTCITRIVSQSRYNTKRANRQTILREASNTEIILSINQATSPTFFLAEMLAKIKTLPMLTDEQKQNILGDYKRWEDRLYKQNQGYYLLSQFNNVPNR